MKVQLVFTPYKHKKFEEDIDIVSQKFGTFPPLGLAYAAAILEKHGHKVDIIDAHALRLSKRETLEKIRQFNPDIIGFMLTAYMFHDTLVWIKFLKEMTKLPVLVGNVLLELYPEEVMSYKEIDYGIIGSAQKSLPALIAALRDSNELGQIEGICYKQDGRVIINSPRDLKEDFETLPFPARHLLPNDKYHEVMSKRKNFTIMITSKGCPYQCNFCHIKGLAYSCRKPEAVLDEIIECYERYKVREIDIFDPTFNVDKKRVIDICNGIINKKLDMDWACRARVDKIDTEMLNLMKKSGCKRILYGIESGEQEILDRVNKGISIDSIKETVKQTRKAGIMTLGFFLLGGPGETLRSMNKTINFSRELKLDYAQFHRTMPKPHTELYEQVKQQTGRDIWREYIIGSISECRFPAPWTRLSQKTIESYTIKAYRKFYFRVSYLFSTLIHIKSLHEFKRYIVSFFGLIFAERDCR